MAITLITYPQDYQPAFNKIVWSFNSDNKTECDFAYMADLYINGSFAIRLKSFPEIDNGYGVFEIERILQDYVSFNFNAGITDFETNINGICSYYLEIRERYNTSLDCTGSTTLSSVLYTTDVCYAWNGALQYHDVPSYSQGKYSLSAQTSRFLTNVPDGVRLLLTDNFNLGFLQDFTVASKSMVIKTYDSSNTLIDTYTLDNTNLSTSSPPPSTDEYYLSIPAGPANINEISFLSSPAPTQPIITSDVRYYTIHIIDESANTISEIKRFDVNTKCSKFNKYSFHWLNTLGQFDSYTFTLKAFNNIDITRTQYNKLLSNNYSIGDRGTTIISVEAGNNYTVNSDWLTEEESIWMKELFHSLEVYVYEKKTTFKTYAVTGAAYSSGFIRFAITDNGVILSTGDTFTYSISNGVVFGISNTGTGTILSSLGGGIYQTDVAAPIDPGISTIQSGSITIESIITKLIPIEITNANVEEKIKANVKNIQYTINFKPSYKINIQSA